MLARIQRLIVYALATLEAASITLAFARLQPWTALVVLTIAIAGYALVLAVEFAVLRRSYRSDDTGRPSLVQLIRAWAGELVAAPRAFLWRQPFFERAFPDALAYQASPCRGVVFVHGFFCNRAIWNPWLRRLALKRIPFVAVNLEPVFGSIDDYRATIDAAVAAVRRTTSLPPVVVAHSMGGLAVRAWLATQSDPAVLHRFVTIASPHAGTRLARRSRARNVSEMRIDSPWLAKLRSRETPTSRRRWICFWSHCDNIVVPTRSATLEGADNRHLRATAHVQMVLHPQVIATVLDLLA